jgi:hypothetical protein
MKSKVKKAHALSPRNERPLTADDLKKITAAGDGAVWELLGVHWG